MSFAITATDARRRLQEKYLDPILEHRNELYLIPEGQPTSCEIGWHFLVKPAKRIGLDGRRKTDKMYVVDGKDGHVYMVGPLRMTGVLEDRERRRRKSQ